MIQHNLCEVRFASIYRGLSLQLLTDTNRHKPPLGTKLCTAWADAMEANGRAMQTQHYCCFLKMTSAGAPTNAGVRAVISAFVAMMVTGQPFAACAARKKLPVGPQIDFA